MAKKKKLPPKPVKKSPFKKKVAPKPVKKKVAKPKAEKKENPLDRVLGQHTLAKPAPDVDSPTGDPYLKKLVADLPDVGASVRVNNNADAVALREMIMAADKYATVVVKYRSPVRAMFRVAPK